MFNSITAMGKVTDVQDHGTSIEVTLECSFWQRDSRPATFRCVANLARMMDQLRRNVTPGRSLVVSGRMQNAATGNGMELILADFYFAGGRNDAEKGEPAKPRVAPSEAPDVDVGDRVNERVAAANLPF